VEKLINRREIVKGLSSIGLGTATLGIPLNNAYADAFEVASIQELARLRGPANNFSTRVIDSKRSGLFLWKSADCTLQVSADPRQAIFVAPISHPTGAVGAWERVLEAGTIKPEWFGAIGDGETDDDDAMRAMADYARHTGQIHIELTPGRLYTYTRPYFLSGIRNLIIDGNGAGFRNIDGGAIDRRFFANDEGLKFVSIFHTHGPEHYQGRHTPFEFGSLIRSAFAGDRHLRLKEAGRELRPGARALLYGFDG
jgi:hypothetical protein